MAEHDDREDLSAFFVPDDSIVPGAALTLGDAVLHHIRVRRLGVGTRIALLDGRGHRGTGTLVRLSKSSATVEVESVAEFAPPPPVHLLVPVADRERMLWLAEKCTELAATSWRPVLYHRSRSVKPRGEGPTFTAKLRARMGSALEQSGGSWLPAIYPDATLERAIGAISTGTRLLLDPRGAPILEAPIAGAVTIAIGPEGGVEEEETARLTEAGFQRVALGGNILRFETAAIAALAITRSALQHAGVVG